MPPAPSNPPYRVGIIGYGLSAKTFHIPFITSPATKSLYALSAIVQRTPSPTNDPKVTHPNVTVYRSTDDLFADKSIDIVIITTDPSSHYSLTKTAIEVGKHVVVEKPFTPSSSEARELVALANQQSVFITVYQNRRFDADFLLLASLIQQERLGRIAEFETHFDRHRPAPGDASVWKNAVAPGTGAAYDLGTHLMDQVVCLFGLPKQVTGFLGSQRVGGPLGFEDSATILLHYGSEKEGRMLATVKAGVVSPETEQLRYWVRGTKGSWKKFHLDPQEDQLRLTNLRPGDAGYGAEDSTRYGTLTEVLGDGPGMRKERITSLTADYSIYYVKLAEALRTGNPKELPVDASVAADVIRLVELARESTRLGKTLDV